MRQQGERKRQRNWQLQVKTTTQSRAQRMLQQQLQHQILGPWVDIERSRAANHLPCSLQTRMLREELERRLGTAHETARIQTRSKRHAQQQLARKWILR